MTNDEAKLWWGKCITSYNNREPDFWERFAHPGFIAHRISGRYGIGASAGVSNRKIFPDNQIKGDVIFAAGDMLACSYQMFGTQKSAFHGKAPTSKFAEAGGLWVARLDDGRIVEEWDCFDELDFLQQLEIIPKLE